MNNVIYNSNSVFYQLDLSALKHFYAVATFGGFSKAARASGQSQPALSLGLQKLEKSLGAVLVKRGAGKFSLTKEGQVLLSFCQRLEGNIESLVSMMEADSIEVRKRFRVGAALSIGLEPLVAGCLRAAKGEQAIDIELTTQRTYSLLSSVLEGTLDAAIVPDDVYESGLKFIPFKQDQLTFVVGQEYHRHYAKKDWHAVIEKMPLITYPRETPMRSLVDRLCLQNRAKFKNLIAVNSVDAIRTLVREGAGGAFMLRSLLQRDLRDKLSFEVKPPFPLPKSGMALVARADEQGESVLKNLRSWLEA